jgi:hypothetical protein
MLNRTLAFAAGILALPFLTLGAQTRGGVTKIELLALQQEMRDEGCGNQHAAGIWDAATRQAIRNCAKKYNTAADARALLTAMSIGFGPGDNLPTSGGAAMGGDMSGMTMSSGNAMNASATSRARKRGMKTTSGMRMKMKGDSAMMHDSMTKMMQDPAMKMMHDSMMKMMQDPAMKAKHDSMMKMMHDSTLRMKRDSTATR